MAHFNRERIPERIVHAKGSGAHGYFVLMSKYRLLSTYRHEIFVTRREQ